MSEIISGNNLAEICDHIFSQTEVDKLSNSGYKITKNFNVIERLKSNQSVFVKTDYLNEFFLLIQTRDNLENITVVTSDSDRVIDQRILSSIPSCVKKMLSINSTIIDDRVDPIPIGIANDYCRITIKPREQQQLSSIGTKALIACNIQNNFTERAPLYQHKFDEEVSVVRDSLSLSDYETVVGQHDFVFCPEGNGPDTHRVWETLYMGKIPIVKTAVWNRSFRDLPIMFVGSFLDVTKESREKFLVSLNTSNLQTKKLNLSYWAHQISEGQI